MEPPTELGHGPSFEAIADRLHRHGDLGLVYLRIRLRAETEHERRLLDVLALAAVRQLEGKAPGEGVGTALDG